MDNGQGTVPGAHSQAGHLHDDIRFVMRVGESFVETTNPEQRFAPEQAVIAGRGIPEPFGAIVMAAGLGLDGPGIREVGQQSVRELHGLVAQPIAETAHRRGQGIIECRQSFSKPVRVGEGIVIEERNNVTGGSGNPQVSRNAKVCVGIAANLDLAGEAMKHLVRAVR